MEFDNKKGKLLIGRFFFCWVYFSGSVSLGLYPIQSQSHIFTNIKRSFTYRTL